MQPKSIQKHYRNWDPALHPNQASILSSDYKTETHFLPKPSQATDEARNQDPKIPWADIFEQREVKQIEIERINEQCAINKKQKIYI